MREEIARRIEDGTLIREVVVDDEEKNLVIAGVDGSSVGGLLALDGTGGDFAFGQAPQVAVNTAMAILNKNIRTETSEARAMLRLPEKPEDMQRRDNKYTMMAKMFYPDLSDSEYMHSTWNAMDLLECRTTLAVMSRWLHGNVELPPVDVVLRDGTVVPHDRDADHYGQQNAYGRIVREFIETNWKIVKGCRDEHQTVASVVKNAQMRVFAPVVNYFLSQVSDKKTQLAPWPVKDMNQLRDQALLSRILTAGRGKAEPWLRTAIVIRPFHATSNLSKVYSRDPGKRPHERLIARSNAAKKKTPHEITEEDAWWRELRVQGDP